MILLPLIHVELVSATEHFTTTALLDSGATLSFIPYEMADILGLIPATNPTPIPVSTAGGNEPIFSRET
jgi:predicted aspartyl protease